MDEEAIEARFQHVFLNGNVCKRHWQKKRQTRNKRKRYSRKMKYNSVDRSIDSVQTRQMKKQQSRTKKLHICNN